VLNELEKCYQLLDKKTSKKIKDIRWNAINVVGS
jgi:hypothetical protein